MVEVCKWLVMYVLLDAVCIMASIYFIVEGLKKLVDAGKIIVLENI